MNMNFMIFGHLPVLCIGIYLAAQNRIKITYSVLTVVLSLFILGNYYLEAWLLGDLTYTILMLALSILAIKTVSENGFLTLPLVFYGGISFHLFMVNGFLRSPFHNFAESYNLWWVDCFAALASLTFSTLFAIGLSRLDQKVRQIITSRI